MKNSLIRKMHLILIITVFAVAIGVFIIVFGLSYNATMNDLREKAFGVRDYVLDSITFYDLKDIEITGEAGDRARALTQEKLNLLLSVGNFTHLYIAAQNEFGDIVTTLSHKSPDGFSTPYVPTGALYNDLLKSFNDGVAVTGRWMYKTGFGHIYSILWPVFDINYNPIAVVCMEFNAESTYLSLRSMVIYSLFLSLAVIAIFSVIAYLSMSKVSEPIYKKIAYLDFLTGLNNRLSYEQRLAYCESLILQNISITIIIFDINNLNAINETLGHKQGDNYIIKTAKIISELVDDLGEAYRIGGDEFASIIVGRKKQDINRLLNALRKERRPVLGRYPFSCAFGAATFTPGVDTSLNALAKRADEEMLREKHKQKVVHRHPV